MSKRVMKKNTPPESSEHGVPMMMLTSGTQVLVVILVTFSAAVFGFFLAWKAPGMAAAGQVHDIRMEEAFLPQEITVEAGRPVEVQFTWADTDNPCDRVVIEPLGLSKPMAASTPASINFTPTEAGDLLVSCGAPCEPGVIHVVTSPA